MILSLLFSLCFATPQNFDQWKKSFSHKAAKRGIPKSLSESLLNKISFNEEVIQKDRNQVILQTQVDYQNFIKKWLRPDKERLQMARKFYHENIELLHKVENAYGVDKEVIVSLWGTETLFGKITGDYDLIESLASLAYDGRRAKFFERQLMALMREIKKGNLSASDAKGSWAGATGQCQFMPSNIAVYGQDFDKDGKVDIWHNKADIFASIAYYLKKVGWQKGKSIGELAYYSGKKIKLNQYRTRSEYIGLGFKPVFGEHFSSTWKARQLADIPMLNSPYILRGSNYKPLLRWNNSSLFAAFNIILINALTAQ